MSGGVWRARLWLRWCRLRRHFARNLAPDQVTAMLLFEAACRRPGMSGREAVHRFVDAWRRDAHTADTRR